MNWTAPVVLAALSLPCVHAAAWIKVSSANFDLLANTSDWEARQTLTAFEEARQFFLRVQPAFAGSPPRATIVSFNSARDYRPYSPNSSVLAYYFSKDRNDTIVIGDLAEERMRVAIHEYVHLLVQHSGMTLPLWLNEGMAEVYSTLQAKDGKLELGTLKDDRAYALGNNNWTRLSAVLAVTAQSPDYNEGKKSSMFYAESCLLTHMLMLDDAYAPTFSRFLERVSTLGSTQEAFSELYGKSVAQMEKEMNTYFRLRAGGGVVYKAVDSKLDIGPAQPADAAEVAIAQAGLLSNLGRVREAKARLEELPLTPTIEAALAALEAETGDKDAGLARLRTAIGRSPEGWTAHWNYARLLDDRRGELAPRIDALQEVLMRNPALREARLRLALDLSDAGRFSEALEQLTPAQPIDPGLAVKLYMEMARAAIALRHGDAARKFLEQAKLAARKPEEKSAVDRLMATLEQPTSIAEPKPDDPYRPILRRKK